MFLYFCHWFKSSWKINSLKISFVISWTTKTTGELWWQISPLISQEPFRLWYKELKVSVLTRWHVFRQLKDVLGLVNRQCFKANVDYRWSECWFGNGGNCWRFFGSCAPIVRVLRHFWRGACRAAVLFEWYFIPWLWIATFWKWQSTLKFHFLNTAAYNKNSVEFWTAE